MNERCCGYYLNPREERLPLLQKVIFGVMNFSVLCRSTRAYKVAREDYESYKRKVLDEERLATREVIFFDYTVPSFLQSHRRLLKDGVLLRLNIAISDQLPERLRKRFDVLVDRYPEAFNIKVVGESESHNWSEVIGEELKKVTDNFSIGSDDLVFANFRLDDDDLLSDQFFSRLADYVDHRYEGFYVTFPKGFVGVYDGLYKSFYCINKPYLAIGLSKICRYCCLTDKVETDSPVVTEVSHTKIVEDSKTILDSSFEAYIWTMHKFSDTRSVDRNGEQSMDKINRFVIDNELNEKSEQEVGEIFSGLFSDN